MTRQEKLCASAAYVANTVLAGGALLACVLFLYIIINLSARDKYFTNFVAVLLYIFPAGLAAVCLACFRLPPSYRINVALLITSTVASIYVAETITTIWFDLPSVKAELPNKRRIEAAKEIGVRFDARTKLAVIADLRSKGIVAYPYFAPINLLTTENNNPEIAARAEFLPLAGISNKVLVACNEIGEYMVYKNDEHGFHNPTGLWNSGRVGIATVGDSFVQGFCVPSEKNFVALIRNRYPSTLNLGIAGQGPLLMLATIKEYARSVKPGTVLWFYHEESSLGFLKDEINSSLLMRYLSSDFSQKLVERQAEIDDFLAMYAEAEMKASGSSKKLEQLFERIGHPSQLLQQYQGILTLYRMRSTLGLISKSNNDNQIRLRSNLTPGVKDIFAQVLLEARTSVNQWGGKVYFVYLPAWRTNWTATKEDKKDILDLAATLGFPIVDVDSVFQAQSDPLSLFALRVDGHYSVNGHRLVAETILKSVPTLSRNASLRCCDHEQPAISDQSDIR